jgi:UDP-glucose 4-epimerase
VVETARKVTGRPIPTCIEPRRDGDPASLIADAKKARALLGWDPSMSDLLTIIRSQWVWRLKHPHGYE